MACPMNEARPWSHTSINKINKIRLTSAYWKIYLTHPKKKKMQEKGILVFRQFMPLNAKPTNWSNTPKQFAN